MPEPILLLRLEHRDADELLKLVEQQAMLQDVPLDHGLLQNICEYFCDYPDKCHHPVEDLIFRKLEERDPQAAARVAGLIAEHEDIAALTGNFAEAMARAGGGGNDRDLREILRHFVERYRSHMGTEEKIFFPLALEKLKDDDWGEIEFDLFDREDPLFDRAEEKRFRHLRSKIETDAEQSFQRTTFLRRARALRGLKNIDEFNRFLTRRAPQYRLVEHANGGYGLERAGEIVIDIPKCSPTRAIWCAYYFLEATLYHGVPA